MGYNKGGCTQKIHAKTMRPSDICAQAKGSRPTMKKHAAEKSARSVTMAYWFTLVSFLIPIVYLTVQLFLKDPTAFYEQAHRTKADYVLMIVQCCLGIIVLHLPGLLSRRFHFDVPYRLYILYILFLYCAIFLGEVRNFYYVIPHWDTILHGFSSIMTGLFGFMVVSILNQSTKTAVTLSPLFVALFAFCFSAAVGSLWEIYEFVFDGMLGMNMQKFLLEDGSPLLGRAALSDTMEDILVDCAGAFIASLYGYLSLKYHRGWIHTYLIEKRR